MLSGMKAVNYDGGYVPNSGRVSVSTNEPFSKTQIVK